MPADLSLAIYTAVLETIRLIKSIADQWDQVRNLRTARRCGKLHDEAKVLLALLNARGQVIESPETLREIEGCIYEIDSFTDSASKSTLVDDTVEVLWKNNYNNLLAKITRLKEKFLFESVNHIVIQGGGATNSRNELLRRSQTLLDLVQELPKDIKVIKNKAWAQLDEPHPTLEIPDVSAIQFQHGDPTVGRGIVDGLGEVVCQKLNDSRLSRQALEIYPKLQAGAYVQQFHGLAEINGTIYVVMQDCSQFPSLSEKCKKHTLPTELVKKIKIAFHVAQTMAWYHRARILLKSVNDETIVLKPVDSGELAPFITGLEHIRHFNELTTSLRYDCRYEAPEYHKMRQHTKYTDVWSLGIVVWQSISGNVPYDIHGLVDSDDKPTLDKIHAHLAGGVHPGEIPTDCPEYLVDIVKKCWNSDPRMRPTSEQVADMLLEAWIRLIQPLDNLESALQPEKLQALPGSAQAPEPQLL